MTAYSHPKSPQKFTQAPLLACLVLSAYWKTTYRGVVEFRENSESLRQRLGLERVPYSSTLKRFADRSELLSIINRMLADVVGRFAVILEGTTRTLTRFAKGGGSFLSSGDHRILFGLGASEQARRVIVKWS